MSAKDLYDEQFKNAIIKDEWVITKSLLQSKAWSKWAIIFICWTGFALFFTSQSYINQARYVGTVEWSRTLVLMLVWSYSWNALTPLILQLSKRFPLQRGKLLRHTGIHFFTAPFFFVANACIYVTIRNLIYGPLPQSRAAESFQNIIFGDFHGGLIVYWLIVAIHQAADYYRKYRERELQASNLEAKLVTAQLDALKMQLHPHFLFNTLNSISVLMRRDIDAADRMLVQLSNLLRVTLTRNEAHQITLKQELEILERYLEIEQTRFQDRLTIKMHIDPSALEALVPQLFFQPLVENAIRHGISERETTGIINIRATRQNGKVYLQVRDNGPGLKTLHGKLIEGIGLSNTRVRLDYLYGSDSSFDITNADDGGLVVAVSFPFHTETTIDVEETT